MAELFDGGRHLEEGEARAARPGGRLRIYRRWRLLHNGQKLLLLCVGCLFTAAVLLTRLSIDARRAIDEEPPSILAHTISAESAPFTSDSLLQFGAKRNERQRAVVDSFLHAWNGYKAYAWGSDELRPVTNGSQQWFNLQLTLIDSLDTAIIMGLQNAYEEGRQKIAADLEMGTDRFVSLFEVTIRILGGLISVYHLTGDQLFLSKAKELGDRLLPAFHSNSGMPYSDVNLLTGAGRIPYWSKYVSLAEVATVQLEFRELSYLTGDPKYEKAAFRVNELLHKMRPAKFGGLYPMFIDVETAVLQYSSRITLGARSDTFYEYLLKQWLQTGKRIDWLKEDFSKSIRAMLKYLARRSEPRKLLFIGELESNGAFTPKMDHLVCYIGGTLALAVHHGLDRDFLSIAKDVAETCRAMYAINPTGLGPEIAHFNLDKTIKDDINIRKLDLHSLLRPEAVETWFYLYRLTNDTKYQDWGWDLLRAIDRHARTASAYCSVEDVSVVPTVCRNKMESFLLAETFKYLYLLFDSTHALFPLDKYVFNTEAHPFPLRDPSTRAE